MEEIFNKFNLVVEQMTDAVANAKDEKDAENIQKQFDAKIESAESVLGYELEAEFKKQEEALKKEHEDSENELKELEEVIEEESNLLTKFKSYLENGLSEKEITKKFKESELIEICSLLGNEFTFKGTKLEKVIHIIETLKN